MSSSLMIDPGGSDIIVSHCVTGSFGGYEKDKGTLLLVNRFHPMVFNAFKLRMDGIYPATMIKTKTHIIAMWWRLTNFFISQLYHFLPQNFLHFPIIDGMMGAAVGKEGAGKCFGDMHEFMYERLHLFTFV